MNKPAIIRKRLGALAALLGILVILESVAALFALSYANQNFVDAMRDIHQIEEAQDQAVGAQQNFHIQVQEWKNVLLRGQNSADYKEYFDRFKAREADVTQAMVNLKNAIGKLGADPSDAAKIATEHGQLGVDYRAALDQYKQTDPATIFAVDRLVRGKDRQINLDIDAIASHFNARSKAVVKSAEESSAELYATLHHVLLVLGGLTILVTIWFIAESFRLLHRARD